MYKLPFLIFVKLVIDEYVDLIYHARGSSIIMHYTCVTCWAIHVGVCIVVSDPTCPCVCLSACLCHAVTEAAISVAWGVHCPQCPVVVDHFSHSAWHDLDRIMRSSSCGVWIQKERTFTIILSSPRLVVGCSVVK